MEKLFELGALLDTYGAFLTERQRSLLSQAVNEDCSLSEIAEREGISRQGVRDALIRGEEQLYGLESKLGLVRRTAQLKNELESALRELKALDVSSAQKAQLMQHVERALDIAEE